MGGVIAAGLEAWGLDRLPEATQLASVRAKLHTRLCSQPVCHLCFGGITRGVLRGRWSLVIGIPQKVIIEDLESRPGSESSAMRPQLGSQAESPP